MNKSDCDGSGIISKRKICYQLSRESSLANVTKKIVLKICTYFIFGH